MRILIDTNILIPLEDTAGILSTAYAELNRISQEQNHLIIVHPGSLEDLSRDKNDGRKQILLSKANKYPILESPPMPDDQEINDLGLTNNSDNDRIDNLILFAIYKHAAHLLITEDRRIHAKAKRLGIADRVHYAQQALNFLKDLHRVIEVKLPDVSHVPLHNIDYRQPFFDSLRYSYPEFDDWYREKSAEGRKAWSVTDDNGSLAALLIYKDELNEHVTDRTTIDGKSLKLCTFKVGEHFRGRKVGELLIKMAFEHSFKNGYRHIYVTIRPEIHDHLKDLVEEFGFMYIGMCKMQRDGVYLKSIPEHIPAVGLDSAFDFYKRHNPFFVCRNVSKYIIPIQPSFHNMLFPEFQIKRQLSLFNETSSVGNTIKKAYLCHAQLKNMSVGDLILFYRSTDIKGITTIGIVERFENLQDPDEISTLVSKRTVYSREQIESLCTKEVRTILFRQIAHFDSIINMSLLNSIGILGKIQSIRMLSDQQFSQIIEHAGMTSCA